MKEKAPGARRPALTLAATQVRKGVNLNLEGAGEARAALRVTPGLLSVTVQSPHHPCQGESRGRTQTVRTTGGKLHSGKRHPPFWLHSEEGKDTAPGFTPGRPHSPGADAHPLPTPHPQV